MSVSKDSIISEVKVEFVFKYEGIVLRWYDLLLDSDISDFDIEIDSLFWF